MQQLNLHFRCLLAATISNAPIQLNKERREHHMQHPMLQHHFVEPKAKTKNKKLGKKDVKTKEEAELIFVLS